MPETTLETASATPYAALVTFRWGANTARYIRGVEGLTIGSDTFAAEPAIDIEPIRYTGGIEDDPAKILLPRYLPIAGYLAAGHDMATVTVWIEECDPTDAAATRRTLYRGVVAHAHANANGNPGLVKVTLQSVKATLKTIRLGLIASTKCPWRFGDENCRVNVNALKVEAECSLNAGGLPRRVLLDFGGDPPDRKYARGFLEYDGLRILVRRHLGNSRFDLARTPPPWWDGATVTVVPGCDKEIATCRYYANEQRFGGVGYALPARNPVFEVPL